MFLSPFCLEKLKGCVLSAVQICWLNMWKPSEDTKGSSDIEEQ